MELYKEELLSYRLKGVSQQQRRVRSCPVNPMIGSDVLEKITTVTSWGGGDGWKFKHRLLEASSQSSVDLTKVI